jgi:hypothetical protein
MEGIFIPIVGALTGVGLFAICLVIARLRKFALAALLSPFITSVVLLMGVFILADMNPAREYGNGYIPNGHEHDPTGIDYVLLWLSTIGVFLLSGYIAFKAQQAIVGLLTADWRHISLFSKNDIEQLK